MFICGRAAEVEVSSLLPIAYISGRMKIRGSQIEGDETQKPWSTFLRQNVCYLYIKYCSPLLFSTSSLSSRLGGNLKAVLQALIRELSSISFQDHLYFFRHLVYNTTLASIIYLSTFLWIISLSFPVSHVYLSSTVFRTWNIFVPFV
jgi:hypothetical protein